MNINEENLRTWLNHLRTATDLQCNGSLAGNIYVEDDEGVDPDEPIGVGYCCLGIGVKYMPDVVDGHAVDKQKTMFTDAMGLAPFEFMLWLGVLGPEDEPDLYEGETHGGFDLLIDWPRGLLTERGRSFTQITAAGLNDEVGLTFPQIADVIDYFGIAGARS